MIKNKFMALTLTVVLTAGMLTGCGSDDKAKDKDAYRQYGINCIENGSYDDAVDAFQKALDQSVGSVGAEELYNISEMGEDVYNRRKQVSKIIHDIDRKSTRLNSSH